MLDQWHRIACMLLLLLRCLLLLRREQCLLLVFPRWLVRHDTSPFKLSTEGIAPRHSAPTRSVPDGELPAALQTGGMPRAFVSTDATYSTLRMFVVAHIGQVVSLGASARTCHAALLIAGASLRVKRHQWRDRDTVQQHRRSDHRGDDAEQVLRHGAG